MSLDRGGFVGCGFGASDAADLFIAASSISVTSAPSHVVSKNDGRNGDSEVAFMVVFWSSGFASPLTILFGLLEKYRSFLIDHGVRSIVQRLILLKVVCCLFQKCPIP